MMVDFSGTRAEFKADSIPDQPLFKWGFYPGKPISDSIDLREPQVYNDNVSGLANEGGDLNLCRLLANHFDISEDHEDEFWGVISESAGAFKRELMVRALPERPIRDIEPRESIIGYIRSLDGLGPWLDAGVLDRPLLRKLSSRAYMALSNWLRDPTRSLEREGLSIPTKAEVNSERLADPLAVRDATRLTSTAYSRSRRQRGPTP